MKLSQFFKTTLLLTALSGCVSNQADFGNPDWRPFKDIDGKIKEISFVEETTAYEMDKSLEKRNPKYYQGYAQLKSPAEKIGALSILTNGNGQNLMAIFSSDKKSFNPHHEDDVKTLAKVKSLDFYEFGLGRVTHAKFTAKKAICEDFNGKNGVDLLMTTNYYPDGKEDFYTALINVKLLRAVAPKDVGYTPSFTGNNMELQTALKAAEKERGNKMAIDNIQEKASLLFNIICK